MRHLWDINEIIRLLTTICCHLEHLLRLFELVVFMGKMWKHIKTDVCIEYNKKKARTCNISFEEYNIWFEAYTDILHVTYVLKTYKPDMCTEYNIVWKHLQGRYRWIRQKHVGVHINRLAYLAIKAWQLY